jgi:uncharacterized membrane protein YphA (DoxX/SURF4 family)
MRLGEIPGRLSAGAYILHSGWEKWSSGAERADGLHAMAAGAYPFFRDIPPTTFVKGLAVSEMAIGSAILAPVVPRRLAGAILTAFAGGLVTMYLRTPALHRPRSYWPTPSGTAISKDIWLLGIGVGLLLDKEDSCGSATRTD